MGNNILIVDDDTDILEGLKMFLEVEGFNVDTSRTAERLEFLSGNSNLPDLIMLDVVLSGKDGREICKKLKMQEITRKIPVLLMSAHPSMSLSLKECLADEFIEKPFNTDFLISKVKKHILN